MLTVRRGVPVDDINQAAKHVLFVEGEKDGVDPAALRVLLRGAVQVQPLGPAFHLRAVADALHAYHPGYYFVVDRDHCRDAVVEASWAAFPDPASANLLVWRRREIENYFLEPGYLARSRHVSVARQRLAEAIREAFQRRLYLDVANLIITDTREEQKENWIELFTRADDLPTADQALAALLARQEFASRRRAVSSSLTSRAISNRFSRTLEQITGGADPLEYGQGRWLELLKGKPVLQALVSNTRGIAVRDDDGKRLQGRDAISAIARDLLARPLCEQPDDFQQLHSLISAAVAVG